MANLTVVSAPQNQPTISRVVSSVPQPTIGPVQSQPNQPTITRTVPSVPQPTISPVQSQPNQPNIIVDNSPRFLRLGDAVKAKFPGIYDHVDSGALGKMVATKFPDVYNQLIDPGVPVETPTQTPQGQTGLQGFGLGALKGIGSTLSGMQSLGQKALEKITGIKTATPSIKQVAGNKLNPNGLTEKLGFGAEQVAEFFIPAGTVAKAGKAADAAIAGLKLGSKTTKALQIAGKVGLGSVEAGGVSKLQGQSNKDALINAAIGGGLGGIIGGLQVRNIGKQSSFVLDLVSPKATEKIKIQALREGRVTEQGLLKASKILPSKRDVQLADVVKNVVSTKKSPVQNLVAIENKVNDINAGVKAYVKVNKVPFNANQLRTQLNQGKDELNLIFASDTQAEKTYDAVVKEFMKHVEKKDTAGLFQARQEFDKIPAIKKLLDSQGLGENTKKEVVLTVRSMANKYVANLLPEGNQYRNTLLQESKMIEVMGNIAEKNTSTIGLNKLQILTKNYPILKWIVGGMVGAGGVGVGGSIIGSSD